MMHLSRLYRRFHGMALHVARNECKWVLGCAILVVGCMPMLTLTAVGRHSGKARSVHLACLEQDGDFLIVASAMGQDRHPAWRYNLEANPEVEVQVVGRRFTAHAQLLDDASRAEIWPRVHDAIPQMKIYESRTDRNICVFRLRPV